MTHPNYLAKYSALTTAFYRRPIYTTLEGEFERLVRIRRFELQNNIHRECHGLVVIGGSGSGKSTAIKHLIQKHPDITLPSPDTKYSDVVSVTVPSPGNLKDLGIKILDGLGYTLNRDRSAAFIWANVRHLLQERRIIFLHLDELQRSYIERNAASRTHVINTLNELMQTKDWPVSLILSGMPMVKDLINEDVQFARRLRPIEFKPICAFSDREMLEDILRSYLKRADMRLSSELMQIDIVDRMVHAGANQFGRTIEMLIQVIEEAMIASQDVLHLEHFIRAFGRRTGCSDGLNPFVVDDYLTIDTTLIFDDLEGKRHV